MEQVNVGLVMEQVTAFVVVAQERWIVVIAIMGLAVAAMVEVG